MKRIILSILLAVGMCSGILLVADWQPSPVSAQNQGKEVPGKSVATSDGTLVCDCTGGGTTCKCLVPKNDDGFEIESGSAN
jgi:hypothetical protein